MNLNELEALAKAVYAPNKDDWELRQALLHFDRAATPENIICLIELVRLQHEALDSLYVNDYSGYEVSKHEAHKIDEALAKYKELTK